MICKFTMIHYYWQIYWEASGINALKLTLPLFLAPGLLWEACLKKEEVKLEFLTDVDMLEMVEKGFRGGMCCEIH